MKETKIALSGYVERAKDISLVEIVFEEGKVKIHVIIITVEYPILSISRAGMNAVLSKKITENDKKVQNPLSGGVTRIFTHFLKG